MKGIEMYYEVDRTQSSGIIGIWICILAHIATLTAENEEEIKELLTRVKEENKKSCLKIQHSKNEDHGLWSHHFLANRWGNIGTVTDFIFLDSKVTADDDYNHEKMLAAWKKSYDQPR